MIEDLEHVIGQHVHLRQPSSIHIEVQSKLSDESF